MNIAAVMFMLVVCTTFLGFVGFCSFLLFHGRLRLELRTHAMKGEVKVLLKWQTELIVGRSWVLQEKNGLGFRVALHT